MLNRFTKIGLVASMCFVLAACQAATQNIPVSSNPAGALVYADGKQVCTAPCNVTLEKTQAHILTFQKEGYKQVDVQIVQKYDTGGVVRDSVETGMRQSSWGTNTEGAVANALLTAGAKEDDGSAYVLSPSSVVVNLVPEGQAKEVIQTGDAGGPVVIDSSQLAPEDREKLFGKEGGNVQTTEPVTVGGAVQDTPVKALEGVLEGAAESAPTIHSSKQLGHSSSSSTTMNSDGSMTTHSSSTSTSVGVSVNPVEAGLGVLHLLEGAEKKEGGSDSSTVTD